MEAQEYLNQNYPLTERSKIKELNISGFGKSDNNKLTGSLDVSDFSNLEKLYCSANKLTNLINLQELNLTKLNITGSLQSLQGCSKLKELSIENTNITPD